MRKMTLVWVLLAALCMIAVAGAETTGSCGEDVTWVLSEDGHLTISGHGEINESAFFNQADIVSVVIEDGVTGIGDHAFYSCANLTSVTVADSVVGIGELAFSYCNQMVITLPDEISSMGYDAFYNVKAVYCVLDSTTAKALSRDADSDFHAIDNPCTLRYIFEDDEVVGLAVTGADADVEECVIPEGVTIIGDRAFYNYGNEYYPNLTNMTIPDSVTSIGDSAFEYFISLETITIPDSVTSIGTWAFDGCENLVITLPDEISSMGEYAFNYVKAVYCTMDSTTAKTLSRDADSDFHVADNPCRLRYIFEDDGVVGLAVTGADGNAEEYIIPDGVTVIADSAFENRSNLVSVTVPDSVTSIAAWAFNGCENLVITLPDEISSMGHYCFDDVKAVVCMMNSTTAKTLSREADCDFHVADNPCRLRYIFEDDEIVGLAVTGADADVEECIIPDGVTEIANYAFQNYNNEAYPNLTSVVIPDGVTSIGDCAFEYCSNLVSITIPDSVVSIGYDAFNGCTGLENAPVLE